MLSIKKNDQVMAITGKDKGKIGRVLFVLPKARKVVVEGLNLHKKAKRKTQQDQQGGLVDIECPLDISNVMLIDKKTNKKTKIKISVLKDGTKVRLSKVSQEVI